MTEVIIDVQHTDQTARELREAIAALAETKARIEELQASLEAEHTELFERNRKAKTDAKQLEDNLRSLLSEQWNNGFDVRVAYDFASVRTTQELQADENAEAWLIENHPSIAAQVLTLDTKKATTFAKAGVFGDNAPIRVVGVEKPTLSKGKLP